MGTALEEGEGGELNAEGCGVWRGGGGGGRGPNVFLFSFVLTSWLVGAYDSGCEQFFNWQTSASAGVNGNDYFRWLLTRIPLLLLVH